MGLINGSLQIGRTALLAHQSAMQVIGNNVANAGNPDFTRQTPVLTPVRGSTLPEGFDSGAGVQLTAVERNIDLALEQRLRQATSDQSHDDYISSMLSRLETLYPDITENGLAQDLNEFFNAFSTLQSTPQDESARSVVTQTGQALTERIKTLRSDIIGIYGEVSSAMEESVKQINSLTSQIAALNTQIANERSSGDTAGALMDQRDRLLKDLAQQVDINVVEQDIGTVTVYIDTEPLIQGNQARELEVEKTAQGDITIPQIVFSDNSRKANVTGGRAGAVDELVSTLIGGNLRQLDTLAAGLIFEINKVHASGQGLHGYGTVTAANAVSDSTVALNQSDLTFKPQNGSFLIKVKDQNTGLETVSQINVNLSGLGAQTTLNSLAADLNGVANLQAGIQPNGQLKISTTSSNYTFTFAEDSSNTLAALGINGFFTGKNAADIDVNAALADDPQLVACAKNNLPGDGSNAGNLSRLRDKPADTLNHLSITDYYRKIVGFVGTTTASAKQQLEIHTSITDTLQSQRDSISGVSLDEETVNLLSNQRAFQGAARFVTVVNALLDEVMQLI